MAIEMRWLTRNHMSQVVTIETVAFKDFPWSEDDFIRCLRQRNCIGKVAIQRERVVGYVVYELHESRLHILNFAVHPSYQKHGIGRTMIGHLRDKLRPHRRNRILLEVRETNLDAQLFFQRTGFRAVSILRDFYRDTTEDAYLMQLKCQQPAVVREPESVECGGK